MLSSNARQQWHGRTDERTNADAWLRTRELLTFRNARARIRIHVFGSVEKRADVEAAA